ncbi:hypothetical protein [Corynebacterium sp. A21]
MINNLDTKTIVVFLGGVLNAEDDESGAGGASRAAQVLGKV